jgi:GTP-binding protein
VSPPDSLGPKVVDARFAFGFTDLASAPPVSLPEIAFAGRSNVGKSSLLNTLMARRNLVRTSSTPGCTRQINVFEAKLEGDVAVHLADLPGFGYARRSKTERFSWGTMMDQYLRQRPVLRLVVILVDARRGPEDMELELIRFLAAIRSPAVPHVFAATKLDKLPRSSAKLALEEVRKRTPGRVVGFSAKTGLGRDALWRVVLQSLQTDPNASPPSS